MDPVFLVCSGCLLVARSICGRVYDEERDFFGEMPW